MNLMFRKNFHEGRTTGGHAGIKLVSKANRIQAKRSREMAYQYAEEVHYRTHIFFSPNRSGNQMEQEERCGPVAGGIFSYPLPPSCDVDAPQPLVDRRPSVPLMKWNASKRNDAPTPLAARQVSFAGAVGATRAEPISLAALDRDCFIIPMHSIARFLPVGITMPPPSADGTPSSPLNVLEVSDPKHCILVHLMSPLEAVDPVLESPLSHPLVKQRSIASELVTEIQQGNMAVGGMLLANMERVTDFPFISYYVINTLQTDPTNFYHGVRTQSLAKFEPKNIRYTAAHTLDMYCEVASICRPPLVLAPTESGSFKKTQTPSTGFIISVFKVFEGDDRERFERNWLYWTGARMLYRYLPRKAGLRRITLHKSISQRGDKMYLLICECSDLLKDISSAAFLIPTLRARLCGYTGLYRPIQLF